MDNITSRIKEKRDKKPFISNTDLAYELIFEDIISGKYHMGEKLHQDKISSEFGMSRSPVRDALIRLEAEGYVTNEERSGFKVYTIDVMAYIEFWEFRRNLEMGASFFAAQNISDDQLNQLKENLKKSQVARENGDIVSFHKFDDEFHKLLVEASNNRYFISVYNENVSKIRFYRQLFISKKNIPRGVTWHKKIIEALEEHDDLGAREAMSNHLKTYLKNLGDKL